MPSLRCKLKENNNIVIFGIQQCDSLLEIFTSTQLPSFFLQAISDEAATLAVISLISKIAECHRHYILHAVSQIFAQNHFKQEHC